MASTRARLTVSYALLLVGTLGAFATAVWLGTRSGAGASATNDVADQARSVMRVVSQAYPTVDTISGRIVVRATRELADVLDPVPGYFVVLSNQDKILYRSELIRSLSRDDQLTVDSTALKVTESLGARVSVRQDSLVLLFVARRNSFPGTNIRGVVAALPDVPVSGQLLIGTMLVLAPIIIFISMIVAYIVVGDAFQPVDALNNEVEAITDGRSLHRRLPADTSHDELARLGLTVNAMLSRLETSFSGLRRFTADASHELKTPLTVLRADVERAMHPATNRVERLVALEEALQETARMSDLVDSLLTLARADEGRFDIYRQPVAVEPLMREVYETAVILGEDAGLSLSMPTLESATVMGDRTRLRQLLLNLVTNAIKYTPRGGRVELSAARRPDDEIVIVVRDTGIGIAANDLPHVFERFWRADRARSRSSERGGFGLGLSISQWVVQAHGGSLTAQSRLGRGSVFTVTLPIVGAASEAEAEELEVE